MEEGKQKELCLTCPEKEVCGKINDNSGCCGGDGCGQMLCPKRKGGIIPIRGKFIPNSFLERK